MATEITGSCLENEFSELKYVKMLVLGEEGIGKTALIKSYLGTLDTPIEELDIEELDIFAVFNSQMKHNGNDVDVGLIDLYPGANAPDRRICYPMHVDVILLCFSIGDHDTLMGVYNLWIHEVRAHFGKLIPVLLVGLKSDYRLFKPGTIEFVLLNYNDDRIVEKNEAEIIHKNYNFHGDYMECSTKDVDSVTQVILKAFLVAMENLISE